MDRELESSFEVTDHLTNTTILIEGVNKPHLVRRKIEEEHKIKLEKIIKREEQNSKYVSFSIQECIKINENRKIPVHNSTTFYRQVQISA